MNTRNLRTVGLGLALALLLAACGSDDAATTTIGTADAGTVTTTTAATATTAAGPCLIIGALYGGPVTDAGYNQAMHDSVMAISENISCVEIIEAENVPEEAGATSTMENMIQQGAGMIIATAFNHQYPALELSNKYPEVIFEHAGGWEMGANFANFFGEPPDTWYMMGLAAGLMTESD